MAQPILIMGLPGSGKTTLAQALIVQFEKYNIPVDWFNADEIRKQANDWDFSETGRKRQAVRMNFLSNESTAKYAICDFVAPTNEIRNIFKAKWTIWLNTIEKGRYEDTNKLFEMPERYDFRIMEQNAEKWAEIIYNSIVNNIRKRTFDPNAPTAMQLGRFQPWHDGHRALFERALEKTGQVAIMVRNTPVDEKNPFTFEQVRNFIKRNLDNDYQGYYEVFQVPNITRISYGRDVGYVIEKEEFDSNITNISATKIRKDLGLN
jgi:adenylylsulfate kinase